MVICWIGKYPDYYKIWLNSCKNNKDWDFLVATDQEKEHTDQNIKYIPITLEDIKRRIYKEIGINPKIDAPYKLCDIKPFYGLIFKQYLRNYDYWGHCDMDLIFGKISSFITDDLLEKYERINNVGHFILYKNNNRMNHLYELDGAIFNYKEVLENSEHYAYDEYCGMNMICAKNQIKQIVINEFVDLDVKHKRYIDLMGRNYDKQIYTYEKGKIIHYYKVGYQIKREEKLYLHFQKKHPAIKCKDINNILICKEGLLDRKDNVGEEIEIYNSKKSPLYERIEIIRYYIQKMCCFMKSSNKVKRIELRRKIHK